MLIDSATVVAGLFPNQEIELIFNPEPSFYAILKATDIYNHIYRPRSDYTATYAGGDFDDPISNFNPAIFDTVELSSISNNNRLGYYLKAFGIPDKHLYVIPDRHAFTVIGLSGDSIELSATYIESETLEIISTFDELSTPNTALKDLSLVGSEITAVEDIVFGAGHQVQIKQIDFPILVPTSTAIIPLGGYGVLGEDNKFAIALDVYDEALTEYDITVINDPSLSATLIIGNEDGLGNPLITAGYSSNTITFTTTAPHTKIKTVVGSYQYNAPPTNTFSITNNKVAPNNSLDTAYEISGADHITLSSNKPLWLNTFTADLTSSNSGAFDLKFDFVVTDDENGLTADFIETQGQIVYGLAASSGTESKILYTPVDDYPELLATLSDTSVYDLDAPVYVAGNFNTLNLSSTTGDYGVYEFIVTLSAEGGFQRIENAVVILNSSEASLDYTYTYDVSSGQLEASIFSDATLSESAAGIWSVSPSAGALLYDLDGNNLSLDTIYANQTSVLEITGTITGFSETCLSFSSEQFLTPAEFCVYPDPENIKNASFTLPLVNAETCKNPYDYIYFPTFTINGIAYPAPTFGFFTITITDNTDNLAIELSSSAGVFDVDDLISSEDVRDGFALVVTPNQADGIPSTTALSFNVTYSSESPDFTAEIAKNLNVRDFPSEDLYRVKLIIDGTEFDSTSGWEYLNIAVDDASSLDFSAVGEGFSYSASDIEWYVNDAAYASGVDTITLNLSSDVPTISSVEVLIADKTVSGYSCLFDFSQTASITFGDYVPMELISFTRNQFSGETQSIATFSNYVSSYDFSAYSCNHIEDFYFSATEGFDSYLWTIGETAYETTDNTLIVPISPNSTLSPSGASVIGVSDFFPPTQPTTEINSADSPNSIVFVELPTGVNATTVNTLINLNNIQNTRFFFDIGVDYSGTSAVSVSGTATITLSSENGETEIDYTYSTTNRRFFFDFDLEDSASDLFIAENSVNYFNICFDLNDGRTIKNSKEWGACNYDVDTLCYPLTVFDGPKLELFTKHHIGLTGDAFEVINETSTELGLIDYFILDDGDGGTHTLSAGENNNAFELSYSAEGCYTLTMSAIFIGGEIESASWVDFICTRSEFDEFDVNVNRSALEVLEIPNEYNCHTIIKPNEFLDSSENINKLFSAVYSSIEYIVGKSRIVSSTFPWNYIGWLGKYKTGTTKWHYNQEYDSRTNATSFGDVVDMIMLDDYFIVAKVNKLEIWTNEFTPSLITTKSTITTTEKFKTISSIAYDQVTKNVYVCDKTKNIIFIFNFNTSTIDLDFISYFGGLGNITSKSKFNSPNDIAVSDFFVCVTDTENRTIKVYNKFMGYVRSLSTLSEKPISLSVAFNTLYALTETGTVYVYDITQDFKLLKTISTESNGSTIHANTADEGIFFIGGESFVFKYTLNGNKIGKFLLDGFNTTTITQNQRDFYISGSDIIHKFIDDYELFDLRDDSNDANLWTLPQILVTPDESVQSFVYNDSAAKLVDNINLIKNSFIKKFVIYISETDDSFVYNTILNYDDAIVECDKNFLFGINERADSYETWDRFVDGLCGCLNSLLDIANTKVLRETDCFGLFWTWKSMKTDIAKATGCCSNPVSWCELKEDVDVGVKVAKTWAQMRSYVVVGDWLNNLGWSGSDSIDWGNLTDVSTVSDLVSKTRLLGPQCRYVEANKWARPLSIQDVSCGCLFELTIDQTKCDGTTPLTVGEVTSDAMGGDCTQDINTINFNSCLDLRDLC